jgi:thiosulfate/3-mercaptopyruvate sulfurtransferase
MTFTTLIDADTLAARFDDAELAIVDCRFDLADTGAGEAAYEKSHIPGAVYAHLDRDLSGVKTGRNGRHPLPVASDLAQTLGRLGIDRATQVVAYDQESGMYASRLWWLLRWMGHDAVAVLDGGWTAWLAGRRKTVAGVETRAARTFVGEPNAAMIASAEEVAGLASSPDVRLVDARAPERYRGDVEPLDPVAGHIPGAINRFFQDNLSGGRFRSPNELRAALLAATGAADGSQIVSYCGSGVTACHNLLALEHAGLPGARLYPGSWSEWVADSDHPVERG